jgi:hypothetical protein
MSIREVRRRRGVLLLLVLLPLAFYLVRRDQQGQSIRMLALGLGWAVSTLALFSSAAARSLEHRLRVTGYRTRQLLLGRLLAITACGLVLAAFYGTLRVDWTLTTSKAAVPALVRTERRYRNLLELLGEIGDARVWGGLHWRRALRDGAAIGGRVAAHVQWHHFQPRR